MGRRTWFVACVGLGMLASGAAVGCFTERAPGDDVGDGASRVSEGARSSESTLLKSTLLFRAGCSGVKVGPRHVLTAARCVAGGEPFVKGGALAYVVAAQGPSSASSAAGTAAAVPRDWREAKLANVHVAPSFTSRCREDSCGLGALVASDAADVAVLELEADLGGVPTLAVDLDPVRAGDPLFVAMSECATLDSRAGTTVLNRTTATPPSAVTHAGSPYEQNRSLVTRLGASYLVTSGPGWDERAPGFCRTDIGGPVFRTNAAVVVGVTAGLTLWSRDREVPVTLHHTRLDDGSREHIAAWLSGLGVSTLRSCSESTDGCIDHGYDAGAPVDPELVAAQGRDGGDAGDAGAAPDGSITETRPGRPTQERLVVEEPEERAPSTQTFDGDAGAKKASTPAASCSASTGRTASGTGATGATGGVAIVVLALARRRRARA